ncbi:MAG TPA: substrate-binding domain-containing protein, partial [Candidatus Binatus sp.]|nr:substrate-binding domain-containing protein [Candidatus Binatus sp.]
EHPENAEAAADAPPGVLERRLRGYRDALDGAGLGLRAEDVVAGRASIDGGEAAFRRAWQSGRRPTAVLAMSDAMAIGTMRAAARLGLGIPRDLSVVGFDDIDLAALVDPALTTVHQPIRRKGVEAVRLLLAEIEPRPRRLQEHVRLETRLVVRDSTGPVRRSNPRGVGAA